MMAQHRDLPVALRGDPVELDNPPLPHEWLVAVPRIVGPLECEERAAGRRHFDENVVEMGLVSPKRSVQGTPGATRSVTISAMRSASSVELFWFPFTDWAWVRTFQRTERAETWFAHGLPSLAKNFSEAQQQLAASQQRYLELARERRLVRWTYMAFLWLLTGMVLFASTWLALYLSRLVTRPVVALAEATQQISRGNLDYRVDIPAADELGDLVRSFNSMAGELAASRRQIETASQELSAANTACVSADGIILSRVESTVRSRS